MNINFHSLHPIIQCVCISNLIYNNQNAINEVNSLEISNGAEKYHKLTLTILCCTLTTEKDLNQTQIQILLCLKT